MASEEETLNLKYIADVPSLELPKSAPQLKAALNLGDLLVSGASFEVDNDSEGAPLGVDDDIDEDGQETEFYIKEYLNNPKFHDSPILKSIGPDEAVGYFDDLVPHMTDVTPDGKLKKKIFREGGGEILSYDGKVWYNYVAYAEGQDSPFDSSLQRGVVETLTFSSAQCIEGISIALQTMKVKEIAKFWIHYEYAYGAMGAPPRIPAAAALMCTIEVLDAVGGDKLKSIFYMTPEERHHVTFEEIMDGAHELRQSGNGYYAKEGFYEAIKRYRKGIDFLENYTTVRINEDEERTNLLYTFYQNIAQSYLKTDQPGKTCSICRRALKLPSNPLKFKILFRFAQAKAQFKDYEDAISLCNKAIGCAPANRHKEMKEFIAKIEPRLKETEQELADMYKKMVV